MIDTAPLFQEIASAFALGLYVGGLAGLVLGWVITIRQGGTDDWH